jgi:hypothetical protein
MKPDANNAPIIVFAYNRPDHLQKTLYALSKNLLADQSSLFLMTDGPKTNEDRLKQKKILELASHFRSSFQSMTVIHSEQNRGLANSIIKGVTQTVEEFGSVIVVEDDLITSPYFLMFMNDGLRRYQSEEKVISIHGYSHELDPPLQTPFFLMGADCWGWATWKRGWQYFEPDGKKLLNLIERRGLSKKFNFENNVDYLQMLRDQTIGKNNSWAVRWYASAFLAGKLTLYPNRSFVQNIGLDGSGTHCDENMDFDVKISQVPQSLDKVIVQESAEGYQAYSKFFKKIKPTLFSRITNRLRMFHFKPNT